MLRTFGFLAFLALTGCATDSGYSQAELLRGVCVEGPGQAYLGQPATAENGELVKAETRARVIRWVAPGQMITMDHSTERVNIYYSPNMKITQITCG
jgi:hypothetical protein